MKKIIFTCLLAAVCVLTASAQSIYDFKVICCVANYVGFQLRRPMYIDFSHFQHNINLGLQK